MDKRHPPPFLDFKVHVDCAEAFSRIHKWWAISGIKMYKSRFNKTFVFG